MEPFVYDGMMLFEMSPVSALPLDEQLKEMEARYKALYEWSYGTFIVTKTHLALVLGFPDAGHVYHDWKTCRKVGVDNEDYEKLQKRAELMRHWESVFEASCIDKTSSDTIPARAIFLAKSVYGYWDTPQNKEENKLSIEVLIKRKEELKALEKKKAKKK